MLGDAADVSISQQPSMSIGAFSLTLKSCGDSIWVGNLEREKAEIFAINLSSRGSFYYANGGG